MAQKGYWALLPYSAVCAFPHLKLSPVGVVPQKDRRPRPIIDYSFTAVNHHTLNIAPTHSMQFGHTLTRILQHIAYANPQHGPPLLLKFDLADGYYRVRLTPQAALELAVVLPPIPGHRHLVGIPLCLPMGWRNSPPFFCAFTETACDLANHALAERPKNVSAHPLAIPSQKHTVPRDPNFHHTIVHPPTIDYNTPPLATTDVYLDDFIGISQSPTADTVLKVLLNSISRIFRHDLHPADGHTRKQTISQSKLDKGDGAWSTEKVILGWLLNTAAGTIQLPRDKAALLTSLLSHFTSLKRTSRRRWYKLLGHLRHYSPALKGANYLFSILQSVLVDQPHSKRLRLPPLVQLALQDWITLATSLATDPVPITTLIPRAPQYVGSTDASAQGIGGFWVPTKFADGPPIVFRTPFPTAIQCRLITADNPSGDLTNSDLELAALVLATAMRAHTTTLCPAASLWCGSDNTAAVSWARRGSTSTTGANAHLLRWMAQLSRRYNLSLTPLFVSGATNSLADFCSRSFLLSDDKFLQEVNTRFPINPSWTLVHPTPELLSSMTLALSSTPSPLECLAAEPPPLTLRGSAGSPSVIASTPIQPCNKQTTPSCFSKSSPIVTAGGSYLPANLRCAVEQWATPYVPWARRWPTWDSVTHASSLPVN